MYVVTHFQSEHYDIKARAGPSRSSLEALPWPRSATE